MTDDLVVACADIGSVRAGNFGWAATSVASTRETSCGTSMEGLVDCVARALDNGKRVALGFECPLFVPLRVQPENLTLQRVGESGRPWSAGAGSGSLATGLVQVAWVLNRLAGSCPGLMSTLQWEAFRSGDAQLLIWEAFVSGSAKARLGDSLHVADAERAVEAFLRALPDVPEANAVRESDVYSLVGAALLRVGLRDEVSVLHESCLVIRA